MSRPPTFDHDEARRLRADGVRAVDIAARFGVVVSRIYQVTGTDEQRSREAARQVAWQFARRVPCANGCGALVNGRYRPGTFCRACAVKARATSVRPDMLHCSRCDRWQPDHAFPHNRSGHKLRHGRHMMCRACNTAIRREYRDRNKVPCSHGCGTMVLHENGGKPPECRICARRRVAQEYRQYREQVAA